MRRCIVEARVRPQRAVVLIAECAPVDDFLLAVKFLSRMWGGRFCHILPVNAACPDGLTLQRLSRSRPELVYTIGVDEGAWRDAIDRACQPRGMGVLDAVFVDKLAESFEQLITVGHVIHHLRRRPLHQYDQEPLLRLVSCDRESGLYAHVLAAFGIPYKELTRTHIAFEEVAIDLTATAADVVRQHIAIASNRERCWLDLTGYGLSHYMIDSSHVTPTIVISGSGVRDLAYFWNLRCAAENGWPAWIMAVPQAAFSDDRTYEALRDWLLSFSRWRVQPDFCRVLSETVEIGALEDIAAGLSHRFQGTHVRYVDPYSGPLPLPIVIPYDAHVQIPVEKVGGCFIFRSPLPSILLDEGSAVWMLDFTKDVATFRAIEDLALPKRHSSIIALNAPCPPRVSLGHLPACGIGADCINVRCSSTKTMRICIPSPEEVLTTALRACGVVPTHDEKRLSYLPVIKMFGGLRRAADAMTGKRRQILDLLLLGPHRADKIKGELSLGKRGLQLDAPDASESEHPILTLLDPETRRIVHDRIRHYRYTKAPDSTTLESQLEFWANRRILQRQWRIGPCNMCLGTFWVSRLEIGKAVRCPGCSTQLSLRPAVPLGYAIQPSVKSAIQQGLIPVVLAARFLRALTTSGFLWLPGLKYEWNGQPGDIDLVASCDGYLVFAECKTLIGTAVDGKTWPAVVDQFRRTIQVAAQCEASVVLLGTLSDSIPETVREEIRQATPAAMGVLFLDKSDMERGYRLHAIGDGSDSMPLSIRDLIPKTTEEPAAGWPNGPREIITPYYRITFGTPKT